MEGNVEATMPFLNKVHVNIVVGLGKYILSIYPAQSLPHDRLLADPAAGHWP